MTGASIRTYTGAAIGHGTRTNEAMVLSDHAHSVPFTDFQSLEVAEVRFPTRSGRADRFKAWTCLIVWLGIIAVLQLPARADVYMGIDGGLEGSATVDDSTTYSSAQAGKFTKENATTTIAEETTHKRSGDKGLRVRNASTTGRRVRSPLTSFSSKTTAVTIQYYRMITNLTHGASNQVGVVRATEALQGTYDKPASASTWQKMTYSPASATFTSLAGVWMMRGPDANGDNVYIDDVAVYDGALDTTAPNAAGTVVVENPTASSLDVRWGAASGGVDSGGYLVVRYASSPAATDDPNVNGIYASNNTITVTITGTVCYQGTGTNFTDTGLSASQTYYYKIYTYDKAYNYAAESSANGTTSSGSSPAIDVLGTNLAVIVISNTSPVYANGTDFGGVGVNQSNVVRTYTITNSGTATLGIGNVSTSGTHASDFVVETQPAASLAANGTTTFRVRFDPGASGTRTATLTFTNNVSGKSPYPFAVQGTGVLAGVLASPASITVTTMVGTALGTQTFGVTNVGRGRLDYSITTNASWLSVSPVTAQLAELAGQQETITFNVTGLYAGTSNATITVDGGATASNTASVAVSVILTNIPDPTAASATVDGKELVRLAWTKNSAFNVLIVYQQGSTPGTPANGTAYSVGNAIPGGGTVIYSGSGATLEHVVRTNAAHYYEFYSINNSHYSPGLSASGSTAAYGDGEIVDQVAYTNGVNLSGLGGGVGWTNNWSDDNPGAFTIAQYSLPAQTNYPGTNANKIVVTPPSDQGRQAYRYFNGYTGGKVYAGYKLNSQYNGANKYSGMSFMQGSTEKIFFGEMYGGDQRLGIGGSVSGSNLYAGVGNDYIVIARYDFDTDVGSVVAYKIGTDAVPVSEPGTWHATHTDGSVTRIDGIRLASGAGSGSGTPGNTYFDEIRVATNWTELLRLVAVPEIEVVGTNQAAIANGDVTSATADGTDFGTVYFGGAAARTNTFGITNSGNAALTISGVTTSSAMGAAADFTILSWPATVQPGTRSNLVVAFNPAAIGVRTALVSIANNDSDETPYAFVLSGEGTGSFSAITFQGFEGLTNDTWNYTVISNGTPVYVDGDTNASGSYALTMRGSASLNADPYVEFDPIDLGAYAAVTLQVAFAVAGADNGDNLELDLSFDGGAGWSGPGSTTLVYGASNTNLGFGGVGSSTVASNPWFVSIPATAQSVRVRLRFNESANDNSFDRFFIDDVRLTGSGVAPQVYLGAPVYYTSETNGILTVPVTLSASASATVRVALAGSALGGGTDYSINSTNILFAAGGATTSNLVFTLNNDALPEGLEDISIRLVQAGGAVVGGPAVASVLVQDDDAFSVMSANLTGGTNIVDGTYTYDETAQRLVQRLRPDVLAIQEWKFTNASARAFVDAVLGTNYYFYIEPESDGSPIPNGVISRWPITASNEWADSYVGSRDHVRVTIDLPGPRDLHVVSVHFKAGVADAATRENEARQLTNYIAGAAIPTNDYLIIAGDLNLTNRSETTFVIVTQLVTDAYQPADKNGNTNSSLGKVSPFDHVLPNHVLNAEHRTLSLAGFSYTNGMIFDSSQFDEHLLPAKAEDSYVVNRAHHPVMKLFNLSTSALPPTVSTTMASATNLTTATAGGNVSADGGATVSNRGVVWAVSPTTPTVPGSQTTNGTGTGSFTSILTNLVPGGTYTYRAFAQNSAGTSYGSTLTLSTPCFSGVITGLTASVTNETDFTASWSNVTGATGYALDVSTNVAFGGASSAVALQDFEISPATPTATYSASGGGIITGSSGTGDRPASSPYYSEGAQAYDALNETATITFDAIDTSSLTQPTLSMRLASFSIGSTGNGADVGDIVTVEISPNNGATYYSTVRVLGNGNAYWSYAGSTGVASTPYDGDVSPVDFQPAGGGSRTTDGYSTIILSNLPAVSQMRIRVTMLNNATSERWVLDDVELTGTLPSFIPGYSNRMVAGTSQSVTGLTGGVTYYFRARATNDYCTTANSATSSVTTSLIVPDIAVRGNNQAISDGDTSPTVTDHTDFGRVGLINSNVVRVYTITNNGLATLTLQNVAIGGTHPGDFTVISQPSLSISPAGSTTFQVRFDPTASGTRTATVFITNNVTGKTPYDFVIQGTGVQAGIVRSPTSISLTTMVGSAPSAQNFGVTNGGLGQLIYTITTNVAWLSVSPVSATLGESAGQQHTVSFSVNGLVAGTSNAAITITDGNASNSPQTVTVALTLTNIPNASAITAWADGREMARLGWTRPTGLDVMLVHRATNAPTAPTQGQAYNVGDVIGGNGSRVIYKGSGAQLEHVILPGQTNHYAFYAINNNHYAPGASTNLSTSAYPAGEIVEVFAYTNGGTLATSGHGGGGNGWTNSWQGDTSSFNVSSGNFANISSYPTGAANRIRINSGDLDNSSKSSTRQFPAITTGKVYAAYTINFAYGGGSKYAGMSFMDNSTEELFFGEGFTGDQKLTVGGTTSASNLYAGIGNDYVVIGMYDFDADTGYVASYKIGTDTVPASEPATWHATVSDSSVTRINGIRLAAGGSGGGVTPGDTYFDEVRVATSWELLLAIYDLPEIDVLGTNRAVLTGANTPDFGNGSDFGAALVTGGQPDRTLFITNSGLIMLNVSGVTTSGAQAADFSVLSWPTKVSPGAVSNLVLRFDPTASGVRTAAVTVVSDDADESSYLFYVRGTGQVPPTVATTIASATNATTATAGGNVSADGFATVTNRGVVWGLSATPTVPGSQTTNGTGTGSYSSTLTNLTPGATYYYRAFAQNAAGTAYGTEYSLITPCFSGSVTGLFASATNILDFTASWSNFTGATGYALDVSTTETFAGSSGTYGSEAFTNVGGGTSSSYLNRQWTNNGVAWTGLQSRTDQTINGTEALTLQNASGSWLVSQSITGGISTLIFKHQRKFGTSGDTGGVDVFVNSTKVATNVPYSDNVVTTMISGIAVSGSFVISITNATTTYRVALDDVTWSNSVVSAAYVPGYSNRAVSATSQSVTGLTSGATYYFRVRATNSYCTSLNSSTASVTTISLLPAMPTGLTASDGTSPLHVALSWNDVGTEDGYLIWRSLTSATNTAAILATNAANVTTYNDTSANPGQIYWYWVSATNLSGVSAISSSNDGYRALSAPSPVTASDGTSTNHVEVTWPGVTGADGYSIWRHTANDSNAATYVSAATLSTAILSEDFEASWVNYPAGWTNLILSGTTNWIRTSGGVSGNPAAAHGGTYNARLATSGSGDFTNRLITPVLNLSGYTNAAVNFWHAQAFFSPDQDLLRVYYRTSSVATWVQLADYTANVTAWTERNLALPNPSADYYLAFEGVATYGYGVCLDDVAVTGTPLSTLSYLDTSAVPGQQYYYWVRATNLGSSSLSGWGTPDTGYRKLATVPGVTASYDTYTTKVEVQWTDITGETGYGIWRYTTDNTNLASYVGSVGAGVTNYSDTSASVGVEYYYWVRGTNSTSSSQGDLQANGALGRRSDPNLAVVTTDDITEITPSGAKGGGNVTFGGGSSVTDRGVVWSTNAMPTTADNKSSALTGGMGTFTNFLSPLIAGQTYYVRAYASNSFALVYGSNKSFTAACFTNTLSGLYANPTNTFDFTANWPAMPGASGYQLDVSTSAIFGVFGTIRAQGFEAAPADTWGFVTAGSVTTSTTRKRTGTYSLRLDGATTALATFDPVVLSGGSASTVTVAFSASGPDADEDLFLSVCSYESGVLSSNTIKLVDGNSSIDLAFNTTNTSTVTTNPYAVTVSAAATQVYVVVYATGLESGEYYYIDDVSLSGFQASMVSGYESRAVAGTSAAVTGLTQNTTYSYRVRPVGAGGCVGASSVTGSVVTLAAPVIGLSTNTLDFGLVAVTVSSNLTLAVTNSGSANLVISSLALSGGCSGSYAVNPSALTVLPGTVSNVVVTFTPPVTGACNATLTLNNNTPYNGAPTVSLTGTGYDPSSIVAPTNVAAVADGAEMVVLGWTKLGTPDVIVLWSSNAITATSLTPGLPYAAGDSGPGGSKVAYHGSANSGVELVFGQSSTNYFRMFGGVGTLYSTNYADPTNLPAVTLKYETGEIIDQFAYTNGLTLAQNNLATGQGWSGGWTGDTNKYLVSDTNLLHGITGYPDPRANKLFWQDTSTSSADDARVTRLLGTARGGRMFVSFMMNYQYAGTEKYVGLSLMSGASAETEEIFFGKPSAFGSLAGIYEPDSVSTLTTTNPPGNTYTLSPGHGNDYVIVGEWYPAQKTIRMWAFATNAVIPQDFTNAPPVAFYSNNSLSVSTITGIRLSAGSSATPFTEVGHVYFDEVRVGSTWDEVLNFNYPKVYDYQVGNRINGTNYVYDGDLVETGKSLAVSYTLYHRTGITNAQFTILDEVTGTGLYPTNVPLQFGANLAAGRQRYTNSVTNRLSVGSVELGTYTSRVFMTASSGRATNSIVVAETGGASDLFFGEFGEGNNYDKYVEIYNGTGGPIDLSQYLMASQTTPGDKYVIWENWSRLSATTYWLDHGSTIVILNGGVDGAVSGVGTVNSAMTNAMISVNRPYLFSSNDVLNVGGDDPVALFRISDTNAWVDVCGIGPSVERYIMRRVEDADVPRLYPLQVATNQWDYRDWESDRPTGYTNFLATAGVYDRNVGLGGYITFDVIDDDTNAPVVGPLTVMMGGATVSETLTTAQLLAGWNFNDVLNRRTVNHGAGTMTDNLASTNDSAGTATNLVSGDVAGQDLTIQGGGNAGRYIQFAVNMQNHQDLILTFAAQRSGTGYDSNTIAYSINNGAFVAVETNWNPATSFTLKTVDLSSVSAADNATNVTFRITLGGGSGGNNRFDNFQFQAQRLVYSFTDGRLAGVNVGNPMHFGFRAYDANSGVPRGTTANGSNMSISITGVITNNTAAYQSSLSSVSTTGSASTSVWAYTSFSYDQIGALYGNGTNFVQVSATMADADYDRPNDTLWRSNEVYGTLYVTDDDSEAPLSVNVNLPGAAAAPFVAATNGTAPSDAIRGFIARRTGSGTNIVTALTDEEMAFAGSRQLQFVFGARDTHGQVSRGTAGTTNTMMSFSLGNVLSGNFAQYNAGQSSAQASTNITTTNFWTFSNGYFDGDTINALVLTGQVAVSLTIPDTDDDRPNDRGTLYAQQAGYLRVVDDDIRGPIISSVNVDDAYGSNAALFASFEVGEGWPASLSSAALWTNVAANGTWVGNGVTHGSLDPKVSGIRRIGLLTNSIANPWIQLPPVTDPGSLTLFAGRFSGNDVTLRVERASGGSWINLGDQVVTNLDPEFASFTWNIDVTGVTTLRVAHAGTGPQVYIDDLSVLPQANWISTNTLRIDWSAAADDYSGVSEHRVVAPAVGSVEPTTTNAGIYHTASATNGTFSILGQQGVITGYVFAIDNDADRTADRAIGNQQRIVVRVDTNPPPVATGLRATDAAGGNIFGGIDESSEVLVQWTPGGTNEAQAAGRRQSDSAALSPWDTFIITYTEVADTNGSPVANATTTTLTKASPAWSSVMTNYAYTNLVLSNLVFDTYYRITIQGKDVAGNIGLSTSVIGNTDRFVVTQGLARSQTQLMLRWSGPTNEFTYRDYDVIYAEAPMGFRNALTSNWQLLQYTNRPVLTDAGDTNRVAPGSLTGTTYRFYRVARQGRWSTNQATRLASEEIYVAKAVTINPGENWYAPFFVPDTSTVAYVFGTNILHGGATFAAATKITWFQPSTGGTVGQNGVTNRTVWLSSSGNWYFWPNTLENANQYNFPVNQGFLIELPTNQASRSLILVGRVPTNEVVHTIPGVTTPGQPEYHILSQSMPERITMASFGEQLTGFQGGTRLDQSDEIRILDNTVTNGVSSGSLVKPKARIWRSTLPAHSSAPWRYSSAGTPSAMYYVIEPDDAVIVVRRGTEAIAWTNKPVMYTSPTKNISP